VDEIPQYRGYTAGSALVFPGLQIDGKRTINQERGCNSEIAARFDLTLECILRATTAALMIALCVRSSPAADS
jgi:hypothetical protein